ncbi:Protein BPS1, chloroplastic [Dillenia turbinata]|uniref:Protein BPS1, chloroplastic n=1 Tax=Dillenia turbinata TaxID=194707 RepID=A0AAN8W4K0_9MAGN
MTSSNTTSKTTTHARSISLPSRSHPVTAIAEESLCRLRALEPTSSISHKFILNELYEDLNEMLDLPSTNNLFIPNMQNGQKSASKDILSLVKECVQELASSPRRKVEDCGLESEVECFKRSRKNATKLAQKCQENLKKIKKNHIVQGQGPPSEVNVLREAEATSLSIFESLLFVALGSKSESKSWVSIFIRSKRVSCENQELYTSEVEKIDGALGAMRRQKSSQNCDFVQVQNLQKQLEAFELRVQDLEDGAKVKLKLEEEENYATANMRAKCDELQLTSRLSRFQLLPQERARFWSGKHDSSRLVHLSIIFQ